LHLQINFNTCKVKKILLLTLLFCGMGSVNAQLNLTYQGQVNYNENLSDIWGYAAPNGDEYGLVGAHNGLSIVDVNDPENPTELFYIDGESSTWRDIKTWGEYCYVTNEEGSGLLVVDLTDLPNSIDFFNWTPNILGLGTLQTAHNIWIDEFGYAYLVGCNINSGGMLYIDLFTDPFDPQFVDAGPAVYAHDVFVRNNLAYASEIYAGEFAVYDVSNKSNTSLLGNHETAANFTHNGWLSDDNTIIYTTDEVAGASVGSYDVSDPSDIIELDQFIPYETLGDGVIPHNVHVWEDWLIISYYTDGCILVDGSNPTNLVEVGNFDTYIPASTGFNGAWGAYPYLPSGIVLVSDIGNGMYVLEPNYVNACWLEGTITDASNSNPISDASIVLMATNVFDASGIDGNYATGYAISGTYDVQVSKPGYETAVVEAVLENGVITILNVALNPLVSFSMGGLVTDELSGDPIPDAMVKIGNDDFSYDVTTNASGNFQIASFFGGDYAVGAGKWGWITQCMDIDINEGNDFIEIALPVGIYDDFTFDFGWQTSGNASTGDWEIGEPVGTESFGGPTNPDFDVEGDCYDQAYVTGNGGGQSGFDDVDDGEVILRSPWFSAANNPVVSYSRWFANYDDSVADDMLEVYLSNGTDEVLLESIDANDPNGVWQEAEYNLSAALTPLTEYRISFITADNQDNGSLVEAAIDLFQVSYDSVIAVEELADAVIMAYPNPSDNELNVRIPQEFAQAFITIWSLDGSLVDSYPAKGGLNTLSTNLANGMYVIQVSDLQGSLLLNQLWTVTR
jgi:choice-of-anchor B domain-containing protein